MHVIPYSHQIFSNIRPLNSNDYLFRDAPKKFLQQLHVELKLRKGEYVIFDDALMHYTSSNHSQSNREAIQIVVIPENAQPKFYNNNSSQKAIDEYNADENFYQNLSIGSAASRVPKDAVKISEIPVTAPRTLTGIAKIILNRIFKYHHSTEEFSS